MKNYFLVLISILLPITANNDKQIKIEKADNLYIGSGDKRCFQKISSFFVNLTQFACNEQFLPIYFNMLNSAGKEQEADGYLSEDGDLLNKQNFLSFCRMFKK